MKPNPKPNQNNETQPKTQPRKWNPTQNPTKKMKPNPKSNQKNETQPKTQPKKWNPTKKMKPNPKSNQKNETQPKTQPKKWNPTKKMKPNPKLNQKNETQHKAQPKKRNRTAKGTGDCSQGYSRAPSHRPGAGITSAACSGIPLPQRSCAPSRTHRRWIFPLSPFCFSAPPPLPPKNIPATPPRTGSPLTVGIGKSSALQLRACPRTAPVDRAGPTGAAPGVGSPWLRFRRGFGRRASSVPCVRGAWVDAAGRVMLSVPLTPEPALPWWNQRFLLLPPSGSVLFRKAMRPQPESPAQNWGAPHSLCLWNNGARGACLGWGAGPALPRSCCSRGRWEKPPGSRSWRWAGGTQRYLE